MRVENPRVNDLIGGKVYCRDCPFADENGSVWYMEGCGGSMDCPTLETYTAACLTAEEAAKGGKE